MTKIRDYNMNGTVILGVDAGYGIYKTARCCFPTSVSRSVQPPIFTRNFLEYNGSYYTIGEGTVCCKAPPCSGASVKMGADTEGFVPGIYASEPPCRLHVCGQALCD